MRGRVALTTGFYALAIAYNAKALKEARQSRWDIWKPQIFGQRHVAQLSITVWESEGPKGPMPRAPSRSSRAQVMKNLTRAPVPSTYGVAAVVAWPLAALCLHGAPLTLLPQPFWGEACFGCCRHFAPCVGKVLATAHVRAQCHLAAARASWGRWAHAIAFLGRCAAHPGLQDRIATSTRLAQDGA